MDMSVRNKNSVSTELVYIGGIGFMFEVNKSLKHNLINPDVLTFFDGVPESKDVTKKCAFSSGKPNTNLLQSIFQNVGFDWIVCSDGVFRKCSKVICQIVKNEDRETTFFFIDLSLIKIHLAGIVNN